MISHHSNRSVSKTDGLTRECCVDVIGLITLLFGGICLNLSLWIRKATECFKRRLMGHPSRSMKDSAKGNMDYVGSGQKVSKEATQGDEGESNWKGRSQSFFYLHIIRYST